MNLEAREIGQLIRDIEAAGRRPEAVPPLRELIRYADRKYYIDSDSAFSDAEYDRWFKLLAALEAEFPEQSSPDSPTQRVAQGLSEKFPPAAHLVPMLSLDNTYNADDLHDWDRKCREAAGTGEPIEYCVEPKYDGASISLVYEQDRLVRGVTRGDGIVGENVTPNVRQIRALPLSAGFARRGIRHAELRGEVVIHKDTFAAFNEQRAAAGLAPLANPRNAASGTLRMLDPKAVAERRLSVVIYHVSDVQHEGTPDPALDTHYGSVRLLQECGFPTPVREMQVFRGIEGVIEYCHAFEARRDTLPYEVDGLVIKVNPLALQDRLGMTTHHPRWAVAYKFSARQSVSRLRGVEFQVGRTGSITPVAKIDPVGIGGVTVTSVSLFNEDIIREKDLNIGDYVLVERAGDVIPYIVRSLPERRDGSERPIPFPTRCPACGEGLEKPEEEAVWRCVNIGCPAQVVERLIHFCSKDAMDIRGMGESNVKKFYDLGMLPDIPGLYRIDWESLGKLEGFGKKSVENLQQSLEQSRTQPLHRLLFGLGIRHVGETMAKTLAHAVDRLQDYYIRTEAELLTLEDVGPKVAASVVRFFAHEENRAMVGELEALGLNLENRHSGHKSEGALQGKTFLFTGTLAELKRSDAEAMAEAKGGKIVSGVSSKLNYLVVGEDAGSKLEKAKKLGTVTVLTEAEFRKLVESAE